MALLKIVHYPEPVLLTIGKPVTEEEFNADLQKLVADMYETMYKAGGVGLAAPQVGVSKRLFVMDVPTDEGESNRIAIINHGRLIANEPTRALVNMAQEKVVEVTVDRDLAAAPAAPIFESIEFDGERTLTITYRKDRANAGQVLDALQSEGLGIVEVSTREPDLEDVFLNLTRAAADG